MASRIIRRFCTKIRDEAAKNLNKESKKEPIKKKPIKTVNVSLQGANCRAGLAAALLLKQHPFIKKIYMHDVKLNIGIARDLNCIDSSAKIESYCGDTIGYSLRAADIVVLLDTERDEDSQEKKFESSYYRVKKLAQTCNLHCPKAVIIVCVEPLIPMVALVQSILEETPLYQPSRLLGSMSFLQSQVNTIVGNNFCLDPTIIHVPLLGGPDAESVVPLISLMTPDLYLSPRDQITFYDIIKKEINKVQSDTVTKISKMSEGYAISKMVITVAKGLNGHDDALASAVARTGQAYPLNYLVSTVKFGLNGIYHNYGIPKITTFELEQLEQSLLLLENRDNRMKQIINHHKRLLRSECK